MRNGSLTYLDPVVTSHTLPWRLWRAVRNLFARPARLQIAALCLRVHEGRREVLLVASRGTGRWILPKGWPLLDAASHRTAKVEAFEEAGVIGKVSKTPYARVRSSKGLDSGLRVATDVLVYVVHAEAQASDYPEQGQREIRWLPVEEAISLADEPEIVDLLRRLAGDVTIWS
ncbi:NUDIX domain-containing protein [Microvirga tunisiensis]|uniref:NUDIX domain-containing protein n=2 Tax=Pannonibacter tanglangensis TaxID=2750084 RepID=A0A7X5F1T3_9HYPH|nr:MULTISPECIES: NUDIX hydrolase [unclassified Pannonibacter]NBN62477.1 NUDIX domain-containing protein [Pannonibacter sp. XCT-34]NBN78133.1 NUDIX domain-containing protein [Pannonibacter sp. XCT-53]